MTSDTIIGIDLGTTNSLVAVVDSGIPMVLADSDGNRLTPSIVAINGDAGEVEVGIRAKRSRHLKPSTTFSSVKRFMGRRSNEISEEEIRALPFPLVLHGSDPVKIKTPGGDMLPEELSAEVLKALVKTVEFRLEKSINRAVITVPAYFNDAQRQATQRAGELAGLQVERIINEPTAAALAYGVDKSHTNARIAVYDFGGGTFDISILLLNDGVFQVLSTSGDTRLGGDDIDMALVQWIRKSISDSFPGIQLDSESESRIASACEEAKIKLSSADATTISLPFLAGTHNFEYQLERSKLDELAAPIIRRTKNHCLRALQDAKLKSSDLDQVILVGGQTRMPQVQQFVSELFECSDFDESRGNIRVGHDPHKNEGPALNTGTHPDEAIALGASIQGAVLSGALDNVILMDVTPLSLGIETFGGLMNVIIPRNTTIPVKAGEMFTNALDNQKSMAIKILQGEREKAADNWELGNLILEFEPQPKATARVGVQFEIDSNGILHVLARNTRTGEDKVMTISSAVDVDDSDVQKMVEESVEYAMSDWEYRQWVEAKSRADQSLEASRPALDQYGDRLETDQKEEIETSIHNVEQILNSPPDASSAGDTDALKQALTRLDSATMPLADLMMEDMSEQWLKDQGLI